ncbi:MAG: NAD(P)H-binding protein [Gammaproteobacteria bacterium]|nr:NAD(P)H-binding protein [Gammaproteobacteria bacterium]
MSTSTQTNTALILGATGGFGSALIEALQRSDWQVRATYRNGKIPHASQQKRLGKSADNIEWIEADLAEPDSMNRAAAGVDVIVHAVNVPYDKWDPLMIRYTRTIIQMAKTHSAQLVFIGNIYNAGVPEGGVITADTPDAPINEKGQLRARLESMLRDASEQGVKVTVLRFGDFFGPNISTNNWFNELTKGVPKGVLSTPSVAATKHTWAYLPDATAFSEKVMRQSLVETAGSMFKVVPFAGHVFSMQDVRTILEHETGRKLKLRSIPWPVLSVLGIVWPLMRDIVSMRYLWDHDIRLCNESDKNMAGGVVKTALKDAVLTTLNSNGTLASGGARKRKMADHHRSNQKTAEAR